MVETESMAPMDRVGAEAVVAVAKAARSLLTARVMAEGEEELAAPEERLEPAEVPAAAHSAYSWQTLTAYRFLITR